MWIFHWIKLSWHSCSVWDKPGWLNWFWQFLCERVSFLIWKDSTTRIHGLTVCLYHGTLCLSWDLSVENCGFLHVFEWLYFTHFHTSFLYQSPSPLCTIFDAISSNIDEDLSINPSANVFVFGDFNVRHKDWLTYSGRADKPGELYYNFSISNDLTQTFLLGYQTVTLTVMLFWIYLFILTLVFVLQWLLLHREFLIMLLSQFPWIFPSDLKRDA